MTDITDDVIGKLQDVSKWMQDYTSMHYRFADSIYNILEVIAELKHQLQRQRERQAVADMFWDNDNPEDSFQSCEGDMAAYFVEYVTWGTEQVFDVQRATRLADRKMRVKVSEDGNDYDWDWVDDAPPADTGKEEEGLDTKRMDFIEAHSKDMGNYTELRVSIHDGKKWHGTLRKAIDAAMSDCPHPIVEELTKE
jgi:hypothetical protein